MICVLTLFGEIDFQPTLKKKFQSNDIFFIEDNCTTSVQLTTQVEARKKEVDAVIIYSSAMNMDIINEYVGELRGYTDHLRIVLILNGDKETFLRSNLNEFKEMKIDLIFDNDGFDTNELVEVLCRGRISNKPVKPKKKESGFVGDIEEVQLPEDSGVKSFAEPQGHFTLGVFNTTRGAGATWTAVNLARYFAMHNYKTCIVDMSVSRAVSMIKLKNIYIYTEDADIGELKSKYNVTIIDFGTPIEVSPGGDNFKLTSKCNPSAIKCFTDCDIKLIMGFSDPWNIQKLNFFFINDIWCSQFDDSYLFIIARNPEKVKKLFPDGNIFSREDDYREHILEAFRKEEDK